MVQINNLDEYNRIKESNFGFLIIPDSDQNIFIHTPSCNILGDDNHIQQREEKFDSINMHWFSTISLAEKKFDKVKVCQECKPE